MVNDVINLNDSIFNAISKYKVIWLGEIHGAKEPAKITEGLVNLFLRKGKKVTLAMEIPENTVNRKDSISLINSCFFKNSGYGNRATTAWSNLATTFLNKKNVSLIFFDEIVESTSNVGRDSIMAMNLLNNWRKKTKLIVLSGNLHNMLEERKGEKKAALQMVLNSKGRVTKEEVLSLNHTFVKGKIMTSFVGEEIKITDFDYSKSEWANQKLYQNNSLYIYSKLNNGWSGQFHTVFVSPATLLR